MVKGINRQVVVVKSPDPKLFEQAIFLLREDAAGDGVSPEQIIQQARQAADDYLRSHSVRGRRGLHLPRAAWGVAGAVLASAAWAVFLFLL
ncbi:MAG: translation initiation factor 2 [Oscillospiraceae bacterium]|nr:translation initiation factor 2 [Oscillospiraceae bacterium]